MVGVAVSSGDADVKAHGPKTEQITINDARDKRQLSNLGDSQHVPFQRRITTNYSPYADASNSVHSYNHDYEHRFDYGPQKPPQTFDPNYSIQSSQYVGGYQHQQYIEAPEPIIEIIIKESNETLPTSAPIKQTPTKKKKEEVQVFYVKYNKDEKKGLVIDDPVAGMNNFILIKWKMIFLKRK